jgi:putative oxidoreductase
MAFSRNKILRIAVVALRVVLGGIFIYAGYVKLSEPWQLFAANILAYEVVPGWAARFLAHTFPWFEVLLGLLLIAGRWARAATTTVSLLLLFFVGLMVYAKLGGKDINCGCFSSNEPISWRTFLRDGSMLAVSLFVTGMAFRNRRKPA